MTREEFYKLTDILNTEVLGSFMHGGEADELIAMFEEAVDHSNILEQEEPVSEELEKAAIDICSKVLKGETIVIDGYEYVVLSDAEECFKAGAKWQKAQDQSTIELAEDHAMLAGMEKMKEQMMSKAIDALVHTFDNGYIRVGTQLLANNKYGLKVGDKLKLIIVKED